MSEFKVGDLVRYEGERSRLLDPKTFDLLDVYIETGSKGVVRKVSGPFVVVAFEGVSEETSPVIAAENLVKIESDS